jgi:formylglycine-generating enzyme required for sulfatase activity
MTFSDLEGSMAELPGGEISMRDDRIRREWSLPIDSFYMCKFAVTQKLYLEITQLSPSGTVGESHPVENVSWADAAAFCNALSMRAGLKPYFEVVAASEAIKTDPTANGYRLPSEAEWQYACCAGAQAARYGELNDIAWYRDNSNGQTHPVGHKAANAWGLHDMLGNVWEWCVDQYDERIYGSYRIFRGGGWYDDARSVMATTRRRSHPFKFKIDDLGFRIARNKS